MFRSIYKVLATVKGKHCAAAKMAVTNGAAYISQRDLALTQFGFMGLVVSKNTNLGMSGSVDEIEGFIHFWRTIGYFMGIEDRYKSYFIRSLIIKWRDFFQTRFIFVQI